MCDGGLAETQPQAFPEYSGPVCARFDIRADWLPLTRDPVKNYFDLKSKIQVFSDELEQILVYREAPSPRHRRRYEAALFRLSQFLREIGFNEMTAYALDELRDALADLDRGIVRHYLAPVSIAGVGNRTPQPADVWIAKAHIAIAVDIAVNGGFGISRRRASKELARMCPFLADCLAPGTPNFQSAIESWHREFSAGRVRDEDAQRMFDKRASMIALYKGRGTAPPDASDAIRAQADLWAAHNEIVLFAVGLTAFAASPEAIEAFRRTLRTKPPS